MTIDPTNPVVALCADGMAAELRGDHGTARTLFGRAWDISTDDYERCIAAHYVARHQDDPAAALEWNERCLRLALSVDDDRVSGFLPSLYLNIGHSHEMLGDLPAAGAGYRSAAERLAVLDHDPYGNLVRDGVARALARIDAPSNTPTTEELR